VLFALRDSPYEVVGVADVGGVAEVGEWISGVLGRENGSRAGKALSGKRRREEVAGRRGAV
jgi:hydroxymethylglutaryl-CoA lyase